jgi:hypothetical protein
MEGKVGLKRSKETSKPTCQKKLVLRERWFSPEPVVGVERGREAPLAYDLGLRLEVDIYSEAPPRGS